MMPTLHWAPFSTGTHTAQPHKHTHFEQSCLCSLLCFATQWQLLLCLHRDLTQPLTCALSQCHNQVLSKREFSNKNSLKLVNLYKLLCVCSTICSTDGHKRKTHSPPLTTKVKLQCVNIWCKNLLTYSDL